MFSDFGASSVRPHRELRKAARAVVSPHDHSAARWAGTGPGLPLQRARCRRMRRCGCAPGRLGGLAERSARRHPEGMLESRRCGSWRCSRVRTRRAGRTGWWSRGPVPHAASPARSTRLCADLLLRNTRGGAGSGAARGLTRLVGSTDEGGSPDGSPPPVVARTDEGCAPRVLSPAPPASTATDSPRPSRARPPRRRSPRGSPRAGSLGRGARRAPRSPRPAR